MEHLLSLWEFSKDSWIMYILAIVGFVVGLAKFLDAIKKIHSHWGDFRAKLSGQKISDKKLKEESRYIAENFIDLVNERQGSEPKVNFDDFQNSTAHIFFHSQKLRICLQENMLPRLIIFEMNS